MAFECLVLTLGFEPGPLLRAITSYGVRSGGVILVFTAEYKDERCERAFLDLQKFLSMVFKDEYGGLSIDIRKIELPLKPLHKGITKATSILRMFQDKEVCIALTGGMRTLWVILILAYMLVKWSKEPRIVAYLEGRGEFVEVPPFRMAFEPILVGTRLEILRALKKRPRTIDDLSIALNRDRSTIYRNVVWLEERGFVQRMAREIVLTDLGKLFCW